jgi:hypothetical protein
LALDNNMKVTLRQPYPGVFGFFLWGILLSRLARLEPLPREEAQHAGAVVKG